MGRCQGGDDQPGVRQTPAGKEDHRQAPTSASGGRGQPSGDDHQDRGAGERGLGRRPEQFARHDVLERDRRVHDGFPGPLHVHARERRVKRLERRRVHGRGAQPCAGEEGDVGNAADSGQQPAQSIAESGTGRSSGRQGCPTARERQLAPDQEVAPPYGQRAHRQAEGRPSQSRSSRPVSLRNTSPRLAGRCRVLSCGRLPGWPATAPHRRRSRTPFRPRPRRLARQRLRLAPSPVRRVLAIDFHHLRPRSARGSVGAAVPRRPCRHPMIARRRHRRSASSMKWVVTGMVLPCNRRRFNRSQIRWRACGSSRWSAHRAPAGPGRQGAGQRQAPLLPPGERGGMPASSCPPARRTPSVRRSSAESARRPAEVAPYTIRFSAAGSPGRGCRTGARRRSGTRLGALRYRARRAKPHRPLSGRSGRGNGAGVVVLPRPFGPSRPKHLPRWSSKPRPATASLPPWDLVPRRKGAMSYPGSARADHHARWRGE